MEFKGTKGKLHVNDFTFQDEKKGNFGSFDIVNEYGEKFGQVNPYEFFGLTLKQAEANALLISKAPEMLEMLKIARDKFLDLKYEHDSILSDIQWEIEELIKQATEL